MSCAAPVGLTIRLELEHYTRARASLGVDELKAELLREHRTSMWTCSLCTLPVLCAVLLHALRTCVCMCTRVEHLYITMLEGKRDDATAPGLIEGTQSPSPVPSLLAPFSK